MTTPRGGRVAATLVAVALLLAAKAGAAERWTLERVLAEARAANARLPVARTDVDLGAAAVRESHAAFGPKGLDRRTTSRGASRGIVGPMRTACGCRPPKATRTALAPETMTLPLGVRA